MLEHHHDPLLVALSIALAIFASYISLDLASSITGARGRARAAWLAGGSLALGAGIWSMHFVAMLAFQIPGVTIAYRAHELVLSIVVAVSGSAIALYAVTRASMSALAYVLGSLVMGAAISGMHYIGISGMRMAADVEWNRMLVAASVLIAVGVSFGGLRLAFRLRGDVSRRGFRRRAAAALAIGGAIAGMHLTAMAAMHFTPSTRPSVEPESLLIATSGLAIAVLVAATLLLCLALTGSLIERALVRREEAVRQLTGILESIIDGFYSVDRDWRFTYVNHVVRQIYRSVHPDDQDPLVGRNLWDVVPEMRGTRLEKGLREAMETGVPSQIEEYFPPAQLWFEARAYPSPDGLAVFFRDITERKRDEQALEEAVRARDEFLSIASHELKTPLTTMKLQVQSQLRRLERMRGQAPDADQLRRVFQVEARQIDRLVRLIEDMLDIARINTGRLEIVREQVDLCELVTDLVDRYAEQLDEAGCTLHLETCEPLVGWWDRFRLEQVAANLLTNAIRYGAGKPIHVSVRADDGNAVLEVRDEGIGIRPEDRERIFRQFERAVPATGISGLGLGLYIVQQIVELHGGRVSVESELGVGSTFTVVLPLGAEGAEAHPTH